MNKLLLTGPAGSGKTHRVLEEFSRALRESHPLRDDLFLVLPSAEHRERVIQILLQRGLNGFFHRRVTTLPRLISETFGVPQEGVISNTARYLLLKNIFTEGRWEYFADVQKSPGVLNLIMGFILELKDSLVSAPFFRSRMNELKLLEPDFSFKYEALAAIYELYQSELARGGLRDPQDNLAILQQKKLENSLKRCKIKKIWFDGFFDFSALQFAYLRELFEMAEEITMTLTYDPDPRRAGLFEGVRPTYEALLKRGFREEALKAESSTLRAEVLAFIEQNIFDPHPEKKIKPSDSLMIFEAVGIEGEVEMIARHIETLHPAGHYRFSDFAILLRQIGDYESVIRSVFSRYRIPVEIHERERLGFSPLIQVIVRLLKIFREGWKRSDLMEFLKSAYVRFLADEAKDYEWAAGLEHWAMEQGVFSGREAWLEPWPGESADARLNADKIKRLKIFADLEDALNRAREFSKIKTLMIEAVEKTFGIVRKADSLEEYVRRDAASFKRFLAILDEIEISFRASSKAGTPSPEISFEQFADRFFRLAEVDLYSLHEKDKNRVQVYSVSLARQKEYRVVFAAGLLEKKFPVQIKEDPILSDWERELFNASRGPVIPASANNRTPACRTGRDPSSGGKAGIQDVDSRLTPCGNDNFKTDTVLGRGVLSLRLPKQQLERYLFYLALTRAREKLILSYPRLDLEGKESLPSYYVQEVKNLFESPVCVKKQDLSRPYPSFEEAINEREIEMGVMGELWTIQKEKSSGEPLLLYLIHRLLERPESRRRFQRAFHEIRAELTGPQIGAQNVFRGLVTSATALEDYAKCAFKYYSKRVLQLQDVEEETKIPVRGIILHEVLEHCFRKWAAEPALYRDKEKALQTALQELEEALRRNPLLTEKKYQYDLECEDLRQSLERFLDHELERLLTSPWRPRYFEFDFGGAGSPYPPFELADGGRKILIRGKIDRIDVDEKREAGLILDYKRRAVFKKPDLEFGTALQLPLYSMVMKEILKLKPAGAELYSIKDRQSNGFYHADYAALFPSVSGRRMILKQDEYQALLERSAQFIRKFSRDMRDGNIAVRPRQCESFCPYASVCRIEKWRLPFIYKEIEEEDRIIFQNLNPKGEIPAGNLSGQDVH